MKYEGDDMKTTRKKAYVPDSEKDYALSRVSIGDAENGVTVTCSYKLKSEAEKKIRKDQGHVPYYGDNDRTHVFEDKNSAKEFIIAELNKLWAE